MHSILLPAVGHVRRLQIQARRWHLLLLQTLQHEVIQLGQGGHAKAALVLCQQTDTWHVSCKYDDFVIQVDIPVFDSKIRCCSRRVRYMIATR